MGIKEKLAELELEMARTQKNKATEGHLGILKSKIAKLRTQLLEPEKGPGSESTGFEVVKYGDARIARRRDPAPQRACPASYQERRQKFGRRQQNKPLPEQKSQKQSAASDHHQAPQQAHV